MLSSAGHGELGRVGAWADGTRIVPLSVGEIVATAVDGVDDPWRLSLVQRDLVWTDTQVRYLLDSLLFGYPIGSLLLCRVSHDGAVLERRGDVRHTAAARDDEWQLLDGQQRVNALVRLFTPPDEARQRRFLVSLTAERKIDEVVQRRSKVDRSLRYIREVTAADEAEDRWQWLDVSGVHQVLSHLTSEGQDVAGSRVGTDDAALALAGEIDPLSAPHAWAAADDATRAHAADRVRRLVTAYVARGVPVVRLALDSPIDVLQVFTRVNRTGVQVAGEDVFFAAVKTLWRDAEENLHRLQVAVPFLSRSSALRVAARCASMELGGADLFPLDVEKLNAERGRELITKMEALMSPGSSFLERAARVGATGARSSGLGLALRHLAQQLFDPVVVWAAGRELAALGADAFAPAWAFVLGAAAFGYRTTFGTTFERLAFARAHAAGRAGEPFPIESIASGARETWPGLTRSRRIVRGVESDDKKCAVVNDNTTTFLLVAQQIPLDLPDGRHLDWEHLFPVARGDENLKWKGPEGSRKLQRHPDSWCISRAGNLLALDASLNRSAGMDWPDDKLRQYREAGHWPPDLFLSAAEEKMLVEACAVLREKKVAEGAAHLSRYVRERELRIFAAVVGRFPAMLELANRTELGSEP